MDLMTVLFGYCVFKSIFNETNDCDCDFDDDDCDDCEDIDEDFD